MKPKYKVGQRVHAKAPVESGDKVEWTGEVLSIQYHEHGPANAPWLYHVAGAPAFMAGGIAPALALERQVAPVGPMYAPGQRVHVRIPKPRGAGEWVWVGTITVVENAGYTDDPAWEYEVSDGPTEGSGEFPLLAWERQLTLEEP